jgi:hypothetical protein
MIEFSSFEFSELGSEFIDDKTVSLNSIRMIENQRVTKIT